MTITNDQPLPSPGMSTGAARLRPAPVGKAYDVRTNKEVTTAFDFYLPGDGAELTSQWHLYRLGDIAKVWSDYTGKGVHVGVYDQGVESAHWDLTANYDASRHVVIDGVTYAGDATPGNHGTSVAGLIGAAKNDRGGVGVAYDSKLTGVNIFDEGSAIDVNAEKKFFDAANQMARFDIANHSWGEDSGHITSARSRSVDGTFASKMVIAADIAARTGRDGLGTIVVGSAGNTFSDGEADAWKSDRHVVAVSAYRQADGAASSYSSHGPHVLIAGPSSESRILNGSGLTTTDRMGVAGYNLTADSNSAADYTDDFGGTSGAAPIVSGVVALVLDANANLGWRDVRDILAASAKMPVAFDTGPIVFDSRQAGRVASNRLNERSFQLTGDAANWNGGAMHYSNDYGYGAADAYNAVRLAEVWHLFGAPKVSANEASATTGVVPVDRTVEGTLDANALPLLAPFNDIVGTPASVTFEMDRSIDVQHVDLTLDFVFRLELSTEQDGVFARGEESMWQTQLKLIAPDGTSAFTYQVGEGFPFQGGPQSFTFGFAGFRGIETKGTWTLQVQVLDADAGAISVDGWLTIDRLKMDLFGTAPTTDDVYTYTAEFFDMVAIRGEAARRTLNDTDGGTDWINAAAIAADVKLSLVGGQGTSFGGTRAFTIGRETVIEGAVTGDGNDTLTGNRFDNKLFGMRGDDWLNGGQGNDTLFGGTGADRFVFDSNGVSGKDTILDWSGDDLIGSAKALRGVGADGRISVGAGAQLLLDGTVFGDTVLLSQNGGAVLQSMGKQGGYFWYAYVSGADLHADAVIGETSFQPVRTAAGALQPIAAHAASPGTAVPSDMSGDMRPSIVTAGVDDQGAFYLYDAMAGSMAGGVLLAA